MPSDNSVLFSHFCWLPVCTGRPYPSPMQYRQPVDRACHLIIPYFFPISAAAMVTCLYRPVPAGPDGHIGGVHCHASHRLTRWRAGHRHCLWFHQHLRYHSPLVLGRILPVLLEVRRQHRGCPVRRDEGGRMYMLCTVHVQIFAELKVCNKCTQTKF